MRYTTFRELTVAQYQELYRINSSADDDTDKVVASIALLTDKPRWEVEEMPLPDFNKVAAEIAIIYGTAPPAVKPKNKITLAGKKYFVQLNPRNLSAGQYIDIQSFMAGNMVENMHKIIACLIVPRTRFSIGKYDGKRHEIISELLLGENYLQMLAINIFFLKLWNNSIEAIQDFLKKEILKKGTNPDLKLHQMDLQRLLGGYIMPVE